MNNPKNNSGFAAGTLIHTQTGLKPIEQIKVGDYLLSKPENGEGELLYKRVVNIFEFDAQEVWYVEYVILKEGYRETHERSFFIATGEHPIWVKGYIKNYELNGINIWEPVRNLAKDLYAYADGAVIELHDGRLAIVATFSLGGLLSRSDIPDYGVVAKRSFLDGCGGIAIVFNNGTIELIRSNDVGVNLDDELDPIDFPEGSVGYLNFGFPPLLRKVHNLEVEDFHTYFVGELGVLVHDAKVKK